MILYISPLSATINSDLFRVELRIGDYHFMASGLSQERAVYLSTQTIKKQVLKWVKMRSGAYKTYGQLNPNRIRSAEKINYTFNDTVKPWTLETCAKVIQANENDFLNLLPSPGSRYYKNSSQFVFDLILWANEQRRSQ